jgi:hypothetical protein
MVEDTFRAQSSEGRRNPASDVVFGRHLRKINHNPRGHRAHATNGKIHHGVRRPGPEGYPLTHGARQLRVGPFAFWLVLGTRAIMAV